MKMKLLPKFIISLGVLGILLTIVIALFSYGNSKSHLEKLYAKHIVVSCKAVSDMLPLDDVKTIISKGGDKTPAYDRTFALFNKLKQEGEITYLSLVIPDEDSVTFYIDALVEEMGDNPANQIPYGCDILYTDAASDEADFENYKIIWDKYAQDKGVDYPIITDNEYGYNYTAVSPILDENGHAIAEIQYILDMGQVRGYLDSFLKTMLFISFAIIAIALLLYIVFVRGAVTAPVAKLASFTKSIITDTGNYKHQRINIESGDEIEDLGNSFNCMLDNLDHYITNLSTVTAEKERIGAELNVATQIQSSMLPCIFPAFPDHNEMDIFAMMNPAKEVGGDFYDFFMVDDTHIAIVIADVSGKGVPAALFMVIAKTLIKDHTRPYEDLSTVFTKVNNILCESNSEGLFVTAFEGILDLVTGEFCYVNAGHEMPFICKKDGIYELFKIPACFVLAGMEDIQYKSGTVYLEPGDKIFQYTDGVTEATNSDNNLYGINRLNAILAKHANLSPTDLLPAIKADIDEFVGKAPQFDDITMLCLEYKQKAINENYSEKLFPASDTELSSVLSFVEDRLKSSNWPLKVIMQITVCVEEIFVNISHYAYEAKNGYAKVSVDTRSGNTAIISLIDEGKEFNPLISADPDITLPAEERPIGGLGIYMVKKSMDSVSYNRINGKNIFIMKKNI